MTKEVRKLIDIVEGKLIPMRKNSIGIAPDFYQFARIFQMMGDHGNYVDSNPAHNSHVFSFYSPLEMEDFKILLKKAGVPWHDVCDEDANEHGEPIETNTVSPVATNPYAAKTKKKK